MPQIRKNKPIKSIIRLRDFYFFFRRLKGISSLWDMCSRLPRITDEGWSSCVALWDGGRDLRLLNISQVAPHGGELRKVKRQYLYLFMIPIKKKKQASQSGREAGAGAAYHQKAWCTNSPTLISAISFYIHHVSIIWLYGNRLGSRPNVFSSPLL